MIWIAKTGLIKSFWVKLCGASILAICVDGEKAFREGHAVSSIQMGESLVRLDGYRDSTVNDEVAVMSSTPGS